MSNTLEEGSNQQVQATLDSAPDLRRWTGCLMRIENALVAMMLAFFPIVARAEQARKPNTSSPWLLSLPQSCQTSVLWYADHEEGTLHDWEYDGPKFSGGGIFNTGSERDASATASSNASFSGAWSAQAVIRNAFRCTGGNKAVRLMRWTDKPWNEGGTPFPREAYYSTWMMISENYNPNKESPWDPGDGGWWTVFQFKSDDEQGSSQPIWTLNIMRDDQTKRMRLYFYTKYNSPQSREFDAKPLPVGKWFHLEAFYGQSGPGQANGRLTLWLDGDDVFTATGIVTCLDGYAIWGIGNYTDHIDGGSSPGSATVYFDDAIVSTSPLHPFAKAHVVSDRTTSEASNKSDAKR